MSGKTNLEKERELLLKRKEELLKDNDKKLNEAGEALLSIIKTYTQSKFWKYENFYSPKEDIYFKDIKIFYNNERYRKQVFNEYLPEFQKMVEENFRSFKKDFIKEEIERIYYITLIQELLYFRNTEINASDLEDGSREKNLFQEKAKVLYFNDLDKFIKNFEAEYRKRYAINNKKEFDLYAKKDEDLLTIREFNTMFKSSLTAKQYIMAHEKYVYDIHYLT